MSAWPGWWRLDGASITAIGVTFEMTRDYKTILPIISQRSSHMTRKAISEDSIYTLKLVRRGHIVPEGLTAAMHAAQREGRHDYDVRTFGERQPMGQYGGITLIVDEAAAQRGVRPCPPGSPRPLGRALTASEYAAASGAALRPLCIVAESDDLNAAIRLLTSLDAEALLVTTEPIDELARRAPIVGVVTTGDMANNIAAKRSWRATAPSARSGARHAAPARHPARDAPPPPPGSAAAAGARGGAATAGYGRAARARRATLYGRAPPSCSMGVRGPRSSTRGATRGECGTSPCRGRVGRVAAGDLVRVGRQHARTFALE